MSIGPILAVAEIRAALAARSVPSVAVSPLVGGRAVKGPADRMLQRLAGGTTPAHVAGCYEGLIDALVVDASDEAVELPAGVRRVVTNTLMTRPRRRAAARHGGARCGWGARVRVAILGGTGSFGRGLAARLVAGGDDHVVIGSRDAERAREAARELGGTAVEGASNVDAVRGADLVVLAVKADAALATAREVAEALGATPFSAWRQRSSSARAAAPSRIPRRAVSPSGSRTGRAPVTAGLHSIAASNLGEAAPEEDTLVCGDDEPAKLLSLELAQKVVAGRAIDAGPLASARALEGLTAVIVNVNRRYKAHAGIRVTGVPAAE